MPERGPRLLVALGGALLAAVLLAPSASGQIDQTPAPSEDPEGRWDGSGFTSPVADPPRPAPGVRVEGQFVYEKGFPGQRLEATLEVHPDGFEPPPGCDIPTPRPLPGTSSGDWDMSTPTTFTFDGLDLQLPCNGRYLIHATARLDGGTEWSMQARFGVAVSPPQVDQVSADLDRAARTVTIAFTPLALQDRPPDVAGYVIERAGPDDETYAEVATVDEDEVGDEDEPRAVDDLQAAEPGEYLYRVRPLRHGVDGPIASDPSEAPTASIRLGGPPTTPTTAPEETDTRADRGAGGRRSSGRPAVATRRGTTTTRLTTPTTLDTGFEDTIDYGEMPETGTEGEELAGDEPVAGQSIVQDEADGVDLAVPAAGALVLLGWAGHIVYLNRLAKLL